MIPIYVRRRQLHSELYNGRNLSSSAADRNDAFTIQKPLLDELTAAKRLLGVCHPHTMPEYGALRKGVEGLLCPDKSHIPPFCHCPLPHPQLFWQSAKYQRGIYIIRRRRVEICNYFMLRRCPPHLWWASVHWRFNSPWHARQIVCMCGTHIHDSYSNYIFIFILLGGSIESKNSAIHNSKNTTDSNKNYNLNEVMSNTVRTTPAITYKYRLPSHRSVNKFFPTFSNNTL